MMALSAIEENGPVKLVSPEEIAAEDFSTAAMMGAPSVVLKISQRRRIRPCL